MLSSEHSSGLGVGIPGFFPDFSQCASLGVSVNLGALLVRLLMGVTLTWPRG